MAHLVATPAVVLDMQSPIALSPLESFLRQPDIEESPAWEFIDGQSIQKPMPSLFHSLVQRNLINAINAQTDQYYALQELRCIVPPFSPVPDISVIAIERFPEEDGPFMGTPDWVIEILAPEQSPLKLQKKILHLLMGGSELAWLIDTQRKQVWVWQGEGLPQVHSRQDSLPSLDIFPNITVEDVMAMTRR